ncbi:hypothetical protein BASA81_008161 [Batrachochytrium salamandrivorans]|nr:hypothetical protein BASA81_008161 [Batrachochytrium salamandrivorans]
MWNHVEPCLSPRKSLMQSIKLRLYKVNDDQVACCHGAFGLSRSDVIAAAFSPTALATKRGRPAGSTKRKAIQREKSLFGARDWVEMFAMWSGWSQFLNMRLRKHLKQQ